jgi:hypothetical protein
MADMTQSPQDQWTPRLSVLEERLNPIATRKVDLNEPDWSEKLRTSKPLDEAGHPKSGPGSS